MSFAGPGSTSRTSTERSAAHFLDAKADQLEGVELAVGKLRQIGPTHRQRRPALGRAVELDRVTSFSDATRERDPGRHAVDVEHGADRIPALVVASPFDDEGAVEAVRATDPADLDELVAGGQSAISSTTRRSSRAPLARTSVRSALAIRP